VGRWYIDGKTVFCSEVLFLLENKINSLWTKTYWTFICSSDPIGAEPHPGYMSYATSFCSTAIIDGSKTNSKYPTRNPTESFARNEWDPESILAEAALLRNATNKGRKGYSNIANGGTPIRTERSRGTARSHSEIWRLQPYPMLSLTQGHYDYFLHYSLLHKAAPSALDILYSSGSENTALFLQATRVVSRQTTFAIRIVTKAQR